MQINVNIGYDQLLLAIKQLPPVKLKQLKAELADEPLKKNSGTKNMQHLLLNGPVMDDEQYKAYTELRKRLNEWNRK